jgi:hypothetical protein
MTWHGQRKAPRLGGGGPVGRRARQRRRPATTAEAYRNSISSSASAADFMCSRAPPSAAAKVLEASTCSVRWPVGDQEGEKGAPYTTLGANISRASVIRRPGTTQGWTVFHLPSTPGGATPPARRRVPAAPCVERC